MRPGVILCFCIAIFALFTSCSDEEIEYDYTASGLQLPLITGYEMRDVQGSTIGVIGDPDIKTHHKLIFGNSLEDYVIMACAPNPTHTTMKIHLVNVPPGCTFYITRATANASFFSDDNFLQTSSIISSGKIIEIENATEVPLIDLQTWEEGYYRAYLIGDGFMLWDNIVIDNSYNIYNDKN